MEIFLLNRQTLPTRAQRSDATETSKAWSDKPTSLSVTGNLMDQSTQAVRDFVDPIRPIATDMNVAQHATAAQTLKPYGIIMLPYQDADGIVSRML